MYFKIVNTNHPRVIVFAAGRIVASLILFWAIAPHSYNYYVVLRFIVCGVTLYGIYRTLQEHEWTFAGCFAAIAILFNPFLPIALSKSTWTLLDIGVAVYLLISIMVVDVPSFLKGSVVGLLVPVFTIMGGIILFAFGVFLATEAYDRLSDSIYLTAHKQIAQGQIIYVCEGEDNDGDRAFTVFGTQYTFRVPSEEEYEGSSILYNNPLEEVDSTKLLSGVTQDGGTFTPSKANPVLIIIEYNSLDPSQNRATEEARTSLRVIIANTLMVGVFIAFICWLGLKKVRDGWVEFKKDMKPITG